MFFVAMVASTAPSSRAGAAPGRRWSDTAPHAVACAVGTYQTQSGTRTTSCTACPAGLTTPGTGATECTSRLKPMEGGVLWSLACDAGVT